MSIIQIGVLGIIAAILSMQFQETHKEYKILIGLGVTVFIFFGIMTKIEVIIVAIEKIEQAMNIDVAYINVIFKMIGITYISELASNICKDAGFGSVAAQIQLFGKITILALSIPVLLALLETIELFLK